MRRVSSIHLLCPFFSCTPLFSTCLLSRRSWEEVSSGIECISGLHIIPATALIIYFFFSFRFLLSQIPDKYTLSLQPIPQSKKNLIQLFPSDLSISPTNQSPIPQTHKQITHPHPTLDSHQCSHSSPSPTHHDNQHSTQTNPLSSTHRRHAPHHRPYTAPIDIDAPSFPPNVAPIPVEIPTMGSATSFYFEGR